MKKNIFQRVVCVLLAMVMALSCAPVGHAHTHAPNATPTELGYELMRDVLDQKLESLAGFDPTEQVTFLLELEGQALLDSKPADKTMAQHMAASAAQQTKLDREQTKVLSKLNAMQDVTVTQTYQVVLNGFAVRAPRSAEAELLAIPGVKNVSVAEVYEYAEPLNGYVPAEHISGEKMGSHLATAEGYTGKGTVTAILDTGLDVAHEAYQADPAGAVFTKDDVSALVAAGGLNAGANVDSLYKSLKVPFAYDYADGDYEVLGSNDHGTHVAGSVGANCDHLTGVAPDTQLVILKVFSDSANGASSEWILAALEDAVVLGVDTINMSLGSACGFSTDSIDDVVYGKVQAAGINLMVSAGNDTDSTYGTNLGVNLPLISEPDNGIVGSPSTYAAAMSVASVNEDAIFQTYLLAGERHIVFSDSNTEAMNFVDTLDGQTLEYVWVRGYGQEADFEGLDLTGKLALVARGGEVAFTVKEENAYKAGAAGLIVYNNEDNAALISMQLGGKLPAVFISKEDGNYLRNELAEKKISISSSHMEYLTDGTNGFMSDFSSLGVTPDLKLKPEITAPGGYVYSTLPDGTYGVMSGTSMASPHMAGAASVLKQYVNESYPDLTDLEKQSLINTLLMNTAKPVLDEYGVAYTPRKQGAGLAQIYDAIHSGAYVTVEGSDRPKADLGYGEDFEKQFTLTVHNLTDADKSYDLSVLALTAQQTTAVGNDGKTYDVISDHARVMPESEFAVTFSESAITVPAGGSKSVNVKLKLTAEGEAKLADFVNGTFLDGYIRLTAAEGVDLSVPYMGFYGDWGKAPVFDDTLYEDEMASVYPSVMANFSIMTGSGFYLGNNQMAGENSPLYDVFDADKVAYASRHNNYGRNNYYMLFSILGLLRAPEKLTYTIIAPDGREFFRNEVEHEWKSFLTSSGYVNYAMGPTSYGWDPLFTEEDGAIWWAPDGDYTLNVDALVAGTDTTQSTSFQFTIDNELPKVTETRYYLDEDGTPYLDVSVTDNHYVMTIQLITGDGTEALAEAELVHEDTRGAVTTFTYDLTAVQAAGYKLGRIAMFDYALNYAESDLFSLVSEFIEADTVTIINQGMTASGDSDPFIIEAMIEPANAKDKTLVWASSNPEVASVEDLGTTRYDKYADVTYYQAMLTPHNVTGDAIITATASNGVVGSATIHVTARNTEPEEPGLHKVLHLDNGRKFYSKDFIVALLNEMAAAGYTQLQLAVGNDGLRFVLDDMTITTAAKTYASDDVIAAIEVGNKAYHDEGEKNALTQSEMDEIIAHADSVGIEIVAHVNMTAHMNAALDAMVELGITDAHFTGYTKSDRSLNLNSDEAVAFTKELLKLYVNYFAGKGCDYFHIGSDEFGNDAYYGNMGFGMMGSSLYAKYAAVINDCAKIVKDAGMTPRAWNDGISYRDYSSSFDTDMEITYWSSGWWGYNVAAASTLASNGHGMINTHGDYYYVLGKSDKFTTGNTTTHDPDLYTACADYELTKFMGSNVEDPIGGMFCIWGDVPDAETETEVAKNIRLILRAMAKRMDGESIDNLDTSVVEGGFNEDGTINGTHEHAFGDWVTTTEPSCTEPGEQTRTCECGETETQTLDPLGHDYASVVTEPSCTEGGYTTHTCARCGDSFVDSETEALGHDYVAVVTPPTETEQGYTTHTCSRCGDSFVDSYTDPLPPGSTKPIPADLVIREDGNYNVPADLNQKVTITDNAREVTLTFESGPAHSDLYFVSQITEGLHLTIVGAKADMGTTYNNKVPFLDFQGQGNVLTLEGENILTSLDNSYMSKALIRVAKGTELTINGEGSLSIDHGGMNPSAAIGSNSGESAGTIIIDGGTLNIVNKGSGAAIGGASSRTAEKIVVNGGTLNLTCEFYQGAYSNNITSNGAGLGTGNYVSGYDYVSGTQNKPPVIEINGGTIVGVTNTGAPIIGTTASSSIGTNITINGGVLHLTSNPSGSSTDAGACIGTARSVSGTPSITINGGEVYAISNSYAAAIGSGPNSKAGNVYIYGGTVTAISTNTEKEIAAIGTGYYGTAGSVWICGGSVKAISASTKGIVTSTDITNDNLDAVSLVTCHMPKVESVSVDGKDFKVGANHPEDEYVYLWLSEGEHEIASVDAHDDCFTTWTQTKAPTCLEEGLEESTCAVCGETRTRALSVAGHTYEAVVTDPSCTEGGYTTHTCALCGDTYVDNYTEALGHSYESVVTEPNCTEGGYTTHTCALCGDTYVDSYTDPTGHSFGDWVLTEAPTCTETGLETRTCHCGETETQTVAALGHDYVATVTDPSCTEGGYTTYVCQRCGDSFVDDHTDPLGHSFGEWVVTVEPTCTEDGEQVRTCHCGETETQILPAYCAAGGYDDLPQDAWYHDAVEFALKRGLMNGMTISHFGPDMPTSRAMMATILYRAAGSPDVTGLSNPFADVGDQWFHDAVIWAYHAGVVNGQSATMFNPDGKVLRQEMVTMLYRYEGGPDSDVEKLETFADAETVQPYAREAFAWAVETGLVNGMGGNTLQPLGTATRAQIATILMRYLNK